MFCGKCGEKLNDNAKFCPKCGNPVSGNDGVGQGNVETEKYKEIVNGNKKNKTVGMIAVAITVLVVVVGGFWLFSGRSYKKTVKEYVNAQVNFPKSFSKKIKELLPEGMWEEIIENEFESEEQAVNMLEEQMEEAYKTLEEHFGEGFKYSYQIVEEKDLSKKDIREIEEEWEDKDIEPAKEVKEGKELTIKVEIKSADGEITVDNEQNLTVVKIGRSWYIAIFDF